MTSPDTDEPIRWFLEENGYFGMPPQDTFIFSQGTMWSVDDGWQTILMEERGKLCLGPDGHGGMLAAFERSGAICDVVRRRITTLFYGQIDNPLLQVCDPVLIGSHLLDGSEATTQVARKRHPLEKVGNVAAIDGRVTIVEYSDLPGEVAECRDERDELKLWAGNLGVHLFDVAFLERMLQQRDALPFHIAHKKIPHIDSRGAPVLPSEPNGYRFERFIFDLIPHARQSLVVEGDRAEAFSPVKNSDAEPTDNARTARAAMLAADRRRLGAAGVELPDGIDVELNPYWTCESLQLTPPQVRKTLTKSAYCPAPPAVFE